MGGPTPGLARASCARPRLAGGRAGCEFAFVVLATAKSRTSDLTCDATAEEVVKLLEEGLR